MKKILFRLLGLVVRLMGGRDAWLNVRRQGLIWHLRTDHYLDRSIILRGGD